MKKFIKSGKLIKITLIVLIIMSLFVGRKLIAHEKEQNRMILSLQSSVSMLQAKIDINPDAESFWNEKGYNYLAIGNSITFHPKTSFWWNECGMAATDANHDYFHIVTDYLLTKYGIVSSKIASLSVWELNSHDRDEVLELLEPYLKEGEKINLISINLGENVSDLSTFKEDFVSLLRYVSFKASNAHIVVIGDFLGDDNRDVMKEEASSEVGVDYISLIDIKNDESYQCGVGTTVYDESGGVHVVEHDGVAKHPGDKGMEVIAERIIDLID